MTLYERCKAYILKYEWAGNKIDGKGPFCTYCGHHQSEGHSVTCENKRLCDDIRLVQRARELEPKPLRLFVWDDVLHGDYTEGIAFALAQDVDEARTMIYRAGFADADLDTTPLIVDAQRGFGVRGGS